MPFDESLLEAVDQAPTTEGFDESLLEPVAKAPAEGESLLVEETPSEPVDRLHPLLEQAKAGAEKALTAQVGGELSFGGDFPSGQAPSPREMAKQAFEPTVPIPGPLAWTKPIEPLLPEAVGEPLAGMREGISNILTGMTSPAMLATLGVGGVLGAGARSAVPAVRAVSTLAGRLLALGFTADMIRNMGPAAAQLGTAVASGDPRAIARAASEAAGNAVMATFAGKAGVEGGVRWSVEKANAAIEEAAYAQVRDQAAADIANQASLPRTGAGRELVTGPIRPQIVPPEGLLQGVPSGITPPRVIPVPTVAPGELLRGVPAQAIPRVPLPSPVVPEVPAEPNLPVLREIRQADARTIASIQALFPKARLSREQARVLRDQAFPPTRPPPPPPPDQGGGGGGVIPSGGPSALQVQQAAPILQAVRAQPGEGPRPVPASEGAPGVLGGQPPEGEAGAGALSVKPPTSVAEWLRLADNAVFPGSTGYGQLVSKLVSQMTSSGELQTVKAAIEAHLKRVAVLKAKGFSEENMAAQMVEATRAQLLREIRESMEKKLAGGAPSAAAAPEKPAPAAPPLFGTPAADLTAEYLADVRSLDRDRGEANYRAFVSYANREKKAGQPNLSITGDPAVLAKRIAEIQARKAEKATPAEKAKWGQPPPPEAPVEAAKPAPAPAAPAAPVEVAPKPTKAVRVGRGAVMEKLFDRETEEFGYDILAFIKGAGRLLSKAEAKRQWGPEKFKKNASMWDDAPNKLASPNHQQIYGPAGQTPDNMAKHAFQEGKLKSDSVNELWAEIDKASRGRAGNAANVHREKAYFDSEMKAEQDWRKATAEGETRVDAGELVVGDVMEVGGERVEVVAKENGILTLKDGRRFGVQKIGEDQSLYVEKLVSGEEVEAEWAPAEEPAKRAPAEPSKVAKLRPMEKQGDILAQLPAEQQPFNLAGEKGIDYAKQQAEAEARDKASEEARLAQEKQQGKLPGITIKPKPTGEAGAIALPPVPPMLEDAFRSLNRNRKAFATLFNARANRRIMDQTIDAADGSSRIAGQRAFKSLELRGSKADREAATVIIEANGDPRRLNHFATQAANDRRALAAVRLAARDWTRLQPLVRQMEQILDRQIAEENAAGIDTAYRDAYVPHLLDTDLMMGRGRPFIISGKGGSGLTTSFMKGRAYDTIFDAIQDGYRPRSIDAADLAEHRVRIGQRLINRQHWADGLRNVFDPTDGQPIVADLVQHQRKAGTSYATAPLGYVSHDLIPGVRIAVHEGYARLFDALTGTSGISSSLPGQLALGTVGGIKHGLLLFDTFHASRIMQKEFFLTGRVSYKKGYSLLEYSDADLGLAEKQGVITPEMATWVRANRATAELLVKSGLNVGRIAENIAPGFIRKLPGIGHFNRWVFDKVTRGAMLQSGLLEFERVSKARPDLSPKDVAMKVARDLNVYYGNLGRQGIFKSGTALDLSRIVFLAPQWVESMARTELQGYGQIAKGLTTDPLLHRTLMTGTLARGVGQGLAAYFLGTQLLNLWTRKQPTWKNEESGHKLDAWIPDWSGKGAGFFLSPFSVVAELTHDMIRYSKTEPTALDAALRIASNKSGPLIRAAKILATGKTFGGEKLIGTWDRAKAAAVSLLPLPIPAQAPIKGTDYPGQSQRQVAASLGFKMEPAPTKQGEILSLASAWLSKQTDPKLKHEFDRRQQDEFGISDYKKLRNALYTGDLKRARVEYDRLRKEDGMAASKIARVMKPRTADGALKPIITPHATERKFLASLTPAQKVQYRAAQQERVELYRTFRRMLATP